jgi:hypothetical protein
MRGRARQVSRSKIWRPSDPIPGLRERPRWVILRFWSCQDPIPGLREGEIGLPTGLFRNLEPQKTIPGPRES